MFKGYFADDEAATGLLEKLTTSAFARLVPLAGTSRQITETLTGTPAESIGIIDQLFRSLPGGSAYLPAQVDALGNTKEGRVMGLAAGTTAGSDPVTQQLAALKIDITTLRRADPSGFDLSGEELSELRRIRGNEAVNGDGYTMKEALAELMNDPEFQGYSKESKQDAIVGLMAEFNEPARELFEERNQEYLANRTMFKSFEDYIDDHISRSEAARMAKEDTEAAGLTPTRSPL